MHNSMRIIKGFTKSKEGGMNREIIYQGPELVKVPKDILTKVDEMTKQGSITEEKLKIYDIIRQEYPNYVHVDNSNARKMLNGIRKIRYTAVILIYDILGIRSGKFIPGRNLTIQDSINATVNP